MKCNLPKLLRYLAIVVLIVTSINIISFLTTSQTESAGGFYKGLFIPISRGVAGAVNVIVTTAAPIRYNSTVTCPGLQMSKKQNDGTFQIVKGDDLFVYSAFQVDGEIKIITLSSKYSKSPLTCQMWFDVLDGDHLVLSTGKRETLPEGHERKYSSAFIDCEIPDKFRNTTLVAVSIVTQNQCEEASNILHLSEPTKMASEFTVCVTPLNYRYSRAYELVEMLEMSKLLGADKLVFYNHSTGPNVDKVLEMYKQNGEVEVLPWHLPIKVDTWPPSGDPEVHYFAQLAALNDCLYRHRNTSKYLVFQDLDEIIVPYKSNTWRDMINERKQEEGRIAVYQFKCVFFRKEWPKPAKSFEALAQKYKSVFLSHTLREASFLTYGSRSKYIADPRLNTVVGVHQSWTYSGLVDSVPESEGALHHYRTWERPDEKPPMVEDDAVARNFGSRLVERLEKVWSNLLLVPMDIDIKTYGDHV